MTIYFTKYQRLEKEKNLISCHTVYTKKSVRGSKPILYFNTNKNEMLSTASRPSLKDNSISNLLTNLTASSLEVTLSIKLYKHGR